MDLGLIGKAAGMFAVTNVDDLVLLAVFFGQGKAARVVAGQFVGFAAILAASVAGALGAGLLPDGMVRWLGVVPLLLCVRPGRRGVARTTNPLWQRGSSVSRRCVSRTAATTSAGTSRLSRRQDPPG